MRVRDALKLSNALDFVDSLSDGIYTILSENGSNLSGGQKQRLSIARAFYKDSSIMIFDEATSSLDSKSEEIITDNINDMSDRKIIFIISHKETAIKYCNKSLELDNGSIIERSSYE